jgi:ferredoxin
MPKSVRLGKREARMSDDVNGMSRRQFFTQLKTGAQQVMVEAAEQHLATHDPGQPERSGPDGTGKEGAKLPVARVMRDGTLPHFIPNRRERLLDRLDTLGQPQAEYLDTRLWGHIERDDALCNSCRMCATFCPTGAIYKFDDPDGRFGIEHYPADCVQCRLCEEICPTGAIRLNSRVPVKELVEGVIETHTMRPQVRKPSAPDSIMVSIKQLFGDNNINDRP